MGGLGVVLGSGATRLGQFDGPTMTVARHGSGEYVLPHQIDHVANMRTLTKAGCDRVLALSSVGGLRCLPARCSAPTISSPWTRRR